MNERLLELEIKKIIQEYKLVLIDEEYKNEVINSNKEQFLREIAKRRPPEEEEEEVVNDPKPTPDVDTDDDTDDEETSVISNGIKKLFREIAKLTHPDKTQKMNNKKELNELYVRAKSAVESCDVYEILLICDRLDIEYKIDVSEKDMLELNLNEKKKQIKEIESSFIWIWITSNTEEEREDILNRFLNKHGKK